MSGTRIALIILVVVAVLVAVGITAGATRHDDGGRATPSWQERLRGFAADRSRLPPGDVSGPGLQGDRVLLPPTLPAVTLTVRPSDQALRTARIRLLAGSGVAIEVVPQSPDRPHVTAKLQRVDDRLALQVFTAGASIVITRLGGGASTVLAIEPDR